jgi:hypothetical protein
MYHALLTCSSGACEAYAVPLLQAVSEPMTYMACPQYMQFQSLQGICPATITCNSRICGAYAVPSLDTISLHMIHMPCPQLLCCIALYYSVLLCITVHCVAL